MPKPYITAVSAARLRVQGLYRLLAVLMIGLALVLGTAAKPVIEIGTGKASAVDIRLIDESTLIMGETSELILDSMVYNPNRGVVEGTITAVKGIFRFSTSGVKMDFTINTPAATIGVRGTEFDVLTKLTETEITVHEGTIEVTSVAGPERVSRLRANAGSGDRPRSADT